MSRIGNKPILLPEGVTYELHGKVITVKGPKGSIDVPVMDHITMDTKDGHLHFTRASEDKIACTNHGTQRALVNNAVIGVTKGFEKTLVLVGIGYRAAMRGENLVLNVGYSHEVVIVPQKGSKITCKSATEIVVDGIDKCAVGETAAQIQQVRRPEPYNGKGILFKGEHILRKEGKRAGKK